MTPIRLDRYPVLARHTEFLDFCFAMESPSQRRVASICHGEVTWSEGGGAQRCTFTIRASATCWEEFAKPYPRPGYQDVFAMVESGHAHITGDVLPFFQNLLLVKAVVAAVWGREWT